MVYHNYFINKQNQINSHLGRLSTSDLYFTNEDGKLNTAVPFYTILFPGSSFVVE